MNLVGVASGTFVSLASAPLVSGRVGGLVDRKKLGSWWYGAAFLGIIGSAALIASTDHQSINQSSGVIVGIVLGLVAGSSYAIYSWVVQRLMADGIGRPAAMGSVFGLGGVLLMPVLVRTGEALLARPYATAGGS